MRIWPHSLLLMLLKLLLVLQLMLHFLVLVLVSVFAGFWVVSLHMQGEVVAAGETALADVAFEGFGARVLPDVTRELIRARESPQTVLVSASVRLLTWRKGREMI